MAIKLAVLYHRMCGYKDSRFISEDVWLERSIYIRGCVAITIAVLYQRMCGYNDSRFISEDVWL